MTALISLHLQDRLRVRILGWVWQNAVSVCAPSDKPCTSSLLPQSNLLDVHWGFNINTQPFCQEADKVASFFWNKTKKLHLLNPGFKFHFVFIIKNTIIMPQPSQNFFTNPYSDFDLRLSLGNKEAKNMESTYWIKSLSSGWSCEAKGSCPLPVSELQ